MIVFDVKRATWVLRDVVSTAELPIDLLLLSGVKE
jgi:hypothetical protein